VEDLVLNKKSLRSSIKAKRLSLTHQQCLSLAQHMSRQLFNTPWFLRSRCLAFYVPVKGEMNTHLLMQKALHMGKQCYLPVLQPQPFNHQPLCFMPYTSLDELITNRYGILEPVFKTHKLIPSWALDIVFLPLVAFDKQLNRLGMGKGYYDRNFSYIHDFPQHQRPLLVGLGYEFQYVEKLPAEKWDIPLDYVVTEKNIFTRKK
jgi:5-formyltetrahydrofolate cyclo-ligase